MRRKIFQQGWPLPMFTITTSSLPSLSRSPTARPREREHRKSRVLPGKRDRKLAVAPVQLE